MRRGDVYWYEHPDAGPRPWVILTRSEAIEVLNQVLAAPATRTVRGIPTEVAVDESDGMPTSCAFTLDNVAPIRKALCTARITSLGPPTMAAICASLGYATACG